ncbi:MAG: hypothetical protein H9W81_01095 [Enterococcus sp.]|nr:hypothetical protein [Enterococcus sp.]
MMEYLLVAGVLTVAALFGLSFFLKIKVIPILIMGAVIVCGINPGVYNVGKSIYQNSTSKFNEYWNGFETNAYASPMTCTKDGSCRNTYDCDPYLVPVTHTQTVSDGKGGTTTQTYTVMETHYHSCPYSTEETSYYVDSTIETFTIARSVMTGPEFRPYERSIPGGRQGAPQSWTEAKARIDSGNPGPVTVVKPYQNYILASQDEFFEKYSDKIETLKEKGLLPTPAQGVYQTYQADKAYRVSNVKLAPDAFIKFKNDVSYLNGAVGNDLQGDLHVVFVPSDVEAGKDDYLNALMAYWQSEELKRNAISKNSIVVVLGISKDGTKVDWAKAETGMPVGNESLFTAISSGLKDAPVDETLLGHPTYNVGSDAIVHSEGKLETILWGENGFDRVSMTANEEDDNGTGFEYLLAGMNPEGWPLFFIGFVNVILAAGLMVLCSWLIISREVMPSLSRWGNSSY